ncbi:hypothetical protein R3I93_018966 [Phoxinus phoxinus]|uniref:Uncharacterized protein n=1 Tax=Phoxinus phoxinus TaxID=58324 RepID=A0AAN9GXT3_9TELE
MFELWWFKRHLLKLHPSPIPVATHVTLHLPVSSRDEREVACTRDRLPTYLSQWMNK